MEILNYILAVIITFLGLFIGFMLALIAKEELRAGKPYFIFLQNLIFSLVIFFLLFFNDITIWLAILIATLTMIFLVKTEINSIVIYMLLAVVFNAAFRGLLKMFIVEAALIFIYGIPTGSLLSYKLKNKKLKVIKEIIIKYGAFVPIATLLFFL